MGLFNAIFGAGTDTNSVKKLINNNAIIVDVRTPSEFSGGHVAGSKNIPLQTISSKVDTIKKWNKPVVLCCASGNRSGQATRVLKAAGITCENGGAWTQVNALV